MTKWAIYGKDGAVRHESRTEYNSDGGVVWQDTFEYSGKWMGECFLTVSVKSAYPIDFQIGDYIEYRGEKFTINYDPTVIKKARRGTYGEGFVYDSIKFNSLSNELTLMRFHDWVLQDNELHYTSLPTFSFYAKDVDDLVDRLQACADRWCKDNGRTKDEYWMFYTLKNNTTGTSDSGQTETVYSRTVARADDVLESLGVEKGSDGWTEYENAVISNWKEAYGADDSYKDSRDDERYDRNISVSSQSVWDGLSMIKQQFGLNFIIRGRNVYVGTAGIPTNHLFKYGKGNGLYEVDKTADQDQLVVTRLHAYGSGDNLPTRYYATLNIHPCVTVASVESSDAETPQTTVVTGFDFATRYFTSRIDVGSADDHVYLVGMSCGDYAVLGRAYTTDDGKLRLHARYEADESRPDYNSDKAAVAGFVSAAVAGAQITLTKGVKNDAWPSSNLIAGTSNLPDNMAVNQLMLPGFPNYALSEICRAEYDSDKDQTNYYITNPETKTEVLFHTESGSHVVKFSEDKYDPYIVSPNAATLGIRDGDISCTEENDDNGLEKVYPTIEEMTDTDAGTGSTGTRLDAVVSADKIDDNGVYPQGSTQEQNIKGFHIYLPALGFDLKQAAEDAGGSDVEISMKDGFCGARTFPVASITTVRDSSDVKSSYPAAAWDLNCKRTHDEDLDLYFPYSYAKSVSEVSELMTDAYQIVEGDHYVLTGIAVSDVNYVWAASVKLLRKAIHWLAKNDYTRYVYSPKIDEIYMAREAKTAAANGTASLHDTLKEGDLLLFQDSDLLLNGSVYIDQLTIKENGNNGIPTYEVTLRDEVTVGTLQRLQNKVDSIASDVRSGNIGGNGLMSTSQVAALIQAYGAEWFLSKTGADTAQGLITLLKGLLVGDGSHGITAEGVATLLSLFGTKKDANGDVVWSISEDGLARLAQLIVSGATTLGGDTTVSNLHTPGASKGDDQSGSGFYLWLDGSTANAVIDNLTVRGKWTAAVLEILKLQYTAGNLTLTGAGGEVWAVEAYGADDNLVSAESIANDTTLNRTGSVDHYRLYFKATDGERHVDNLWHVGDQVRCQTFNLTDGTYKNAANRMYYRVVEGVGSEVVSKDGVDCFYIDVSNKEVGSLAAGSKEYPYYGLMHTKGNDGVVKFLQNDAPEAGDSVAHVGSVLDADRQGAVQLVAVGDQAIRIYGGINETLEDLSGFIRINLAPSGSTINTRFLTYTNGWKENRPMIQVGDWTPGTVAHATEVYQWKGSSWLCVAAETTDEPSKSSSDWQVLADSGDAAAYDLQLSRYQGMITVDDRGNVIGGLYSTATDASGNDVRQYKLSTAVYVRKGTEILLEEEDSSSESSNGVSSSGGISSSDSSDTSLASAGHYKIHVESDDCECFVKNSTVYIKSIKNLRDSDGSTDESIDYDAMRKMSGCRVVIVVDCEGVAAKTIEFPIRIAHDQQPFMACDLSNEHASVGWNTKTVSYYGLPLETGVDLLYQNKKWAIDYITVKAVGASATAANNNGVMEAQDVTDGYAATLGVDLDGNAAIITLLPTGLSCYISEKAENGHSRVLRLSLDGTGSGDFLPKVLNLNVHVVGTYAGVQYEYDKIWTIDKASDVTLFDVVPTVDQIVVDADGVISVSTVGCSVMATSSDDKRFSVGADMLTSLGLKIQYSVDSLSDWKDYTDVVTMTADNLYVAFRLVSTDGTVEYDRETVPVVKQGKDGTSFKISGTAKGHFSAGAVDMPTVADYMTSIGYTPSSGDYCLYSPVANADATVYGFNGSAWGEWGGTLAEGDCWLVDQTKDTAADGHIFAWVKSGSYHIWKDMGQLKGPAGKDGQDAEYYELVAEPSQLHVLKSGALAENVVVRLVHVVGANRTEVTGEEMTLSTDSHSLTGTSPMTIGTSASTNLFDISQDIDDEQTEFLSVKASTEADASDLTIPVHRDGSDGVGYYINPPSIVVTEEASNYSYDDNGVVNGADYAYTGIPTSVAIHKTVGSVDSIVEAKSINANEGDGLLVSGDWAQTLKDSFTAAGGYDFTSIMSASTLNKDTTISKIEIAFQVSEDVTLLCDVYINRLGTTTVKTIGDTTTIVRNKVVYDLGDSTTDIYNAVVKASSQSFTQTYSKDEIDDKNATLTKNISEIEQTAKNISLTVKNQRSGRNLWLNGDFEMSEKIAPAYTHNVAGSGTSETDGLVSDDVPAGFNKALAFSCKAAFDGIFWKKAAQKYVEPEAGKAYCLSFFGKATSAVQMQVGFEGISTGVVSLTTEWQRFAVYFPSTIGDWSGWNGGTGAVVFYPTSAMGDGKVLITGIQFETGTESGGAPTVFENSTYDWTSTGIDIRQGVIEATADQFTWRNSSGTQTMAVDAEGNLTITNVHAEGITATGGTFTNITAEGGTFTNMTSVNGTFTNATVTGKITANSGEIAGFTINSNYIGTRSDVIDGDSGSYGSHNNMWLTDEMIGFNDTDRQTIVGTFYNLGVPMLARFYDNTSEYAKHYGIVAGVRNTHDESEVLRLLGGSVSGLALKVKLVDCSTAAQSVTLTRETVVVTSIGTKACNLTLPEMYPYDDGHVIIIKGMGTGGVNIYPGTYINTSAETKNSYVEYDNGDVVVAPSGKISLGNSMDSMMLVFHHGLSVTVSGTKYEGCWVQYKLPRSW